MKEIYSSPVDWVGQKHLGFVINTAFSQENSAKLTQWLSGLRAHTSEGVYCMDQKGLHITVLDWVAPLLDYGGVDKRQLYEKLRESYEPAFRAIVNTIEPFDIDFNEVRVTPGAVILVGQDGGQFQSLRDRFTRAVPLPEGGKQPPTIVHSSLARFVLTPMKLSIVEDYVAHSPLRFTQPVDRFRLVETRQEPMQDFTVLDTFPLK